MKVKFYHRFFTLGDIENIPHHYLYAASKLKKHGIDIDYILDSSLENRIVRGLRIALKILFDKQPHDLLYASTANGLEILVLLRSMGLYRKPIVVWQHRALMQTNNLLIKIFLRFYFRGFDEIFMFTKMHIEQSIQSGVIDARKLKIKKWGPDLNFYNQIESQKIVYKNTTATKYFCSNGRENRDFPTLLNAFSRLTDQHLKIYTSKVHGLMNNEDILSKFKELKNIHIKIMNGASSNINFLATEVLNSYCMVICCKESDYTVGLTSLYEAMALGKAIITSDNPYYPIDVEKENVGIKVAYGDVDGWANAIKFLSENEDLACQMGENGKRLVENAYNLNLLSADIANVISSFKKV